MNGWEVVAIINFEFNQFSCLTALCKNYIDSAHAQLILQRYMLWKFQCNPSNGSAIVALIDLSTICAAVYEKFSNN